jgi:AraC-like DNA-binding protein
MPDSQVVSQLTYLRDSALPGVEMLVANPSTASWCMFHERYLLCGCTSVSTSWSYRRKSYDMEDGATGLMEPGEIHRVLAKRKASHFLTLFIERDQFARLAQESGAVGVPHFQVAKVADGRLLQSLAHLARELRSGRNGLKLESSFAVLMQRVLKYTESRPVVVRGSSGPALRRSLERAREILEERQNEQVTLDELAKAAALSRFHLVRSFAKEYGIPPHAYQISVRIKRACRLLRTGMPCVEVAAAAGFADQSHFTRHFKKIMGVAPGIYASPHSFLRGAPSFASSAGIQRPAS